MRDGRRDPLPGNRLVNAILSLQPTAYWPLDETAGPLRSLGQSWPATVTGSPTYGVAAPNPIGKGITFASGEYATTATNITTPTASVSVLALFATTDATAALRSVSARAAASQNSWEIRLNTAHTAQFRVYQADGTQHAIAGPTGVVNDGAWHLILGTFDGTTVICSRDSAARATSTSLVGSWHTASTAAVNPVRTATVTRSVAHVAYWADRVITDTERLWLYSIMAGA